MEYKAIWIILGCLLATGAWSCDRNQAEEICVMTAITNMEGDTIATLVYEEGRLVRINESNPVSVRRFLYDNSLLVREEFFGLSSTLQRYRSYFYEDTSKLVEMIEYRPNLSGEWLPAYRERYSNFFGNYPGVMKTFSISGGREILTSYYDFDWLDAVLVRSRRWEQIPSSPDRLRVAEINTYTYDSRSSPWPDIPAIEIWKRVRNPLVIESTLIEYLPQGNTSESLSQKGYEYRYDRDGKVIEGFISDPSGINLVQEFHYVCAPGES